MMHRQKTSAIFIITVMCVVIFTAFNNSTDNSDDNFVVYTTGCWNNDVKFYWKDDEHRRLKSLKGLKTFTANKSEQLLFGMNAGMYNPDHSPVGLYIQDGKVMAPVNNNTGAGNFYLQPNGIFFITSNKEPGICTTTNFIYNNKIAYATQSGPMLLINGQIHPSFNKNSSNLTIRNGVGILPDKKLIFVMSKYPVNFYEFAAFFKEAGCLNSLYLDGFVSRTYLPAKEWIQLDGDFGVMIGVTNKK